MIDSISRNRQQQELEIEDQKARHGKKLDDLKYQQDYEVQLQTKKNAEARVNTEKLALEHEAKTHQIQDENQKTYSRLQNQHQQSLRQVQETLQSELKDLKNQAETQQGQNTAKYEKDLKDIHLRHELALFGNKSRNDQELKNQEAFYAEKKNQLSKHLEQSQTAHENQIKEIHEKSQAVLRKEAEEADLQRLSQRQSITDKTKEELTYLSEKAKKSTQNIRENLAQNLKTYNSKATDPFYRHRSVNPKVSDLGDRLMVQMEVPEYERDSILLRKDTDQLVISTARRFEDGYQAQNGHSIKTQSYQTSSERLSFPYAVDMKKMSKNYDNGVLTFIIPKMYSESS